MILVCLVYFKRPFLRDKIVNEQVTFFQEKNRMVLGQLFGKKTCRTLGSRSPVSLALLKVIFFPSASNQKSQLNLPFGRWFLHHFSPPFGSNIFVFFPTSILSTSKSWWFQPNTIYVLYLQSPKKPIET